MQERSTISDGGWGGGFRRRQSRAEGNLDGNGKSLHVSVMEFSG